MSITPLLQTFVKIGHQLEKDRAFGRIFVQAQNLFLHSFVWPIRLRHIAILQLTWDLCASRLKKIIEMIHHCAFLQPLVQPIVTREIRLQILERRCPFVSERELNLAKLHGLKSRCCFQSVAKTRKRRWRHRFENVDLCHEYFHDGAHTFERVDRPEEIACGKISLNFVKLMQQLLKPKLVRLMDDDEQRLIVFRRAGSRLLKRKQFFQIEIARIG